MLEALSPVQRTLALHQMLRFTSRIPACHLFMSAQDHVYENHRLTLDIQFPCGRVKRFLKNNTQNKMRVGAKGI